MGTPFNTTAPAALVVPATAGQLKFVAGLLNSTAWSTSANTTYVERTAIIAKALDLVCDGQDATEDTGAAVNDMLAAGGYDALTKTGASKLIDWLKTNEAKVQRPAAGTYPDVPAGRYAVATEDGAINELAFYKVDCPTEGRWAGFTFVKHIVGSDELSVRREAKLTVLNKIAADIEGAAARYGHEIGRCGFCDRQLTNDVSRERGIGPECAKKYL